MKRLSIGLVLLAFLFLSSTSVFARDNRPDATLKFVERGVAIGFGISWGEGAVAFKGKDYPFKIHGLSFNDIGISKVNATGKVYDLKNIEDINGSYRSVGSEATMGKGVGAIMMKNENGVSIEIITLSKGARATLSVNGVELKLK